MPVEPPPIHRGQAPPEAPYAPGFDALQYAVAISLPDTGSAIRARAVARIAVVSPRTDTLRLDLSGLAVTGLAVAVGAAAAEERPFLQRAGKLIVPLPAGVQVGDTLLVSVDYEGRVDDGLIVRPDVHGDWTVFADDWPDRARFWFPCIDHPSDKAAISFAVSAPAGRMVLANGLPMDDGEASPTADSGSASVHSLVLPPPDPPEPPAGSFTPRHVVRWATPVPIPTYTMVIAAADIAEIPLGSVCDVAARDGCVGVSAWSFHADSARAARIFRRAPDMLRYYAEVVGPFSYEKLAHVQSATMFGGMENASIIFYDEKAIAAGSLSEGTVAHETAHQWFGDAVTEAAWPHLWLSEGFATYFSALFFEHADGEAAFRDILQEAAETYFASAVVERPVLDTTQQDLFELLDANSYQKGAWVLHMLRGVVGDSAFFSGIRDYYAAHRNGNALTRDLRAAMERASGRELGWFFDQWLRHPGYPQLTYDWSWNTAANEVTLQVSQVQPDGWPAFRIPMAVAFATPQGEIRRDIELTTRHDTLHIRLPVRPTALHLDPDAWILKQVAGEPPAPASSPSPWAWP